MYKRQGLKTIDLRESSALEELDDSTLIVKIPEPLTFTNTEDLKERLNRLERFRSVRIHPGRRPLHNRENIKYVIFELGGMTSMDSSAAQILKEIIKTYKKRSVNVYFCKVSSNLQIRTRLHDAGIDSMIVRPSYSVESIDINTPSFPLPYFGNVSDALSSIQLANPHGLHMMERSSSSSFVTATLFPVSYTHLDVYKRQG